MQNLPVYTAVQYKNRTVYTAIQHKTTQLPLMSFFLFFFLIFAASYAHVERIRDGRNCIDHIATRHERHEQGIPETCIHLCDPVLCNEPAGFRCPESEDSGREPTCCHREQARVQEPWETQL